MPIARSGDVLPATGSAAGYPPPLRCEKNPDRGENNARLNMTQRTALITGGMGGLGETISTKMHDAGYRVVVTRSPGNNNAPNWLADMKARSYQVAAFPIDVADYDSCELGVSNLHRGSRPNRYPHQQRWHHEGPHVQKR